MFPKLTVTLAGLMVLKPALAVWSLEFYETGCPPEGEDGTTVAITAGGPEDELWCISANSAHNVVATGIAADSMIATLFADTGCSSAITEFETDGCKVIPTDITDNSPDQTVIEAVRILPK